jgi:hypothetical protein
MTNNDIRLAASETSQLISEALKRREMYALQLQQALMNGDAGAIAEAASNEMQASNEAILALQRMIVDLSRFLRQPVKSQNLANGEFDS